MLIKMKSYMLNKLLIVIPARAGSKRLLNKNRVLLNSKELFLYSAEEALKIRGYRLRVIVSTDDAEIERKCFSRNIEVKKRLPIFALDFSPKQDVIKDVCNQLWEEETYIPDLVISLQANSPEVTKEILEDCLEKFIKKKAVNNCKELICINEDGNQNGSIRIMTYKTVFQDSLSTYLTTHTKNLSDIHTKNDLIKLKKFQS